MYDNATKKLLKPVIEKLHSNESINGAWDYLSRSVDDVIQVTKKGFNQERLFSQGDEKGFLEEIYKTGKKNAKNEDTWNYGRIAGSYMVASGAVRIATGGGLYRDGNGNNDIIGIPGI